LHFYFLLYGGLFLLEKKKMPSTSFFVYLFIFEVNKMTAQVCCRLFYLLFFVANKAMTTSLLPLPNYCVLLFEVKKMMGFLSSFIFFLLLLL
jgi:hypothetical protein